MPKQTNEFQELVTMVQQALAPVGAKVTSSAMVDIPGQTSQREIDVLIETSIGPYSMIIAVEAKDEGRKMDQPHFEQILAKYQSDGSIKVNKLVIVTHQGYCKPVVERARLLGSQVELLTYSTAKTTDWSQLYPKFIRFRIAPHFCNFSISPPIDGVTSKQIEKEAHIVCCHGTDHGLLSAYIAREFRQKIIKQRPTLFDELNQKVQSEPSGQAFAHIQLKPGHQHFLIVHGNRYPIKEIRFSIHVVDSTVPMEYHNCEIASTSGATRVVQMANAIAGGKRLRFVMPDGLKSDRLVLRIDSADMSADERRAMRSKRKKKQSKKRRG